MAEIVQYLGFDAKSAIASLNALGKAITGVNTKLLTFNKRTGAEFSQAKVIQGFAQVGKQAQVADAELKKLNSTYANAANAAEKAGQKIGLSFQDVGKIAQVQVLLSTIRNLITGLNSAANAAAEFQLQVGRIANIARGPGSSIDALKDSLAELSVELGRPITEVGAAAYEALQNDLGDTAETMQLLRGAANDLALITGGDLTQSVNSLSSVLKSYSLDANQASHVTDILFDAIDKGRITLADLEASLGTIAPLAVQLDIDFRELAAGIATITQTGTSAATATTQLRNVLNKLIKPSEELQAIFEQLGVDTFKELQERSGGLKEALEEIANAVGNDEERLAKAFNTIRGQLGVLNLLTNEGKLFEEVLAGVGVEAGRAAEAAQRIKDLDATKAAQSYEALQKHIRDLGDSALVARTILTDMLVGVIDLMGGIELPAALAAAGISALAITFGAATLAANGFALSLALATGGLSVIAGLVAGAFSIGIFAKFITGLDDASKQIADKIRESQNQLAEARKQIENETTKDLEQQIAARNQITDEWAKEESKKYFDVYKVAKDNNARILEDARAAVAAFVDARKNAIKQIEDVIKNIDRQISESQKRIRNGMQTLAEFNFDRSLRGLTEQEQASKLLEQSLKEAAAAKRALANSGINESKIANAREMQEIAEKRALEALSAAEKLDDQYAIQRAEENYRKVVQQRIDSEKRKAAELEKVNEGRYKKELEAAKKRFEQEEALLNRIIELKEELLDPNKSPAAKLIDRENLQKAGKEFSNLVKQDLNVDLFQQFGVQSFVNRTTNALSTSFADANFQFSNVSAQLQAELSKQKFQVSIAISNLATSPAASKAINEIIEKAASEGGNPARVAQEVEKGLLGLISKQEEVNRNSRATREALKSQTDALKTAGDELTKKSELTRGGGGFDGRTMEQLNKGKEETREIATIVNDLVEKIPNAIEATAPQLTEKISQARQTVEQLIANDKLTADQAKIALSALETASTALATRLEGLKLSDQILPVEEVAIAKERLAEIQAAIDTAFVLGDDNEVLQAINNIAQNSQTAVTSTASIATNVKNSATNMGNLDTATQYVKAAVDTIAPAVRTVYPAINGAIVLMRQLEAAARAAAQAAANATSAGGGKYHGGKVNYRALGGPITRGQDTILTPTSPGEFIMNARSTRKFAAQLQSMNAGQNPQYREHGGSVTTVGDINVTVQNTSQSPVSGSEIANSLRREIRRKTSIL